MALKLKFGDPEDLSVVATLLQDALIEPRLLRFWPQEGRFAELFYRFCWEACSGQDSPKPVVEGCESRYSRRLSSLIFTGIGSVETRNLVRSSATPLALLSIQAQSSPVQDFPWRIEMIFAGKVGLRLHAKRLFGELEDKGEPTPTAFRPAHSEDAA